MSAPTAPYPERITERRERVAELTRRGFSAEKIAEELRVTTRTVQRDRTAMGIARPFTGIPLTDDEIRRARDLLDGGCSVSEVARTLGRSDNTLHKHFPGRAWTRAQVAEHLTTVRRWRHLMELRGVSCR